MATLRMPDPLAREVVAYCISAATPTYRSDEVLRMLISALSELPVESAHIVPVDEGRRRYADVVLEAEYADAFTALFPRARRLGRGPRGSFVFRLAGCGELAAYRAAGSSDSRHGARRSAAAPPR